MRLDCTTDKYGALYARWLDNPTPLLDYAGANATDVVLDLCGGTGIVAQAARERGCAAAILDLNPRCCEPYIAEVRGRAEDAAEYYDEGTFTLVVCRQAINYLNLLDVGAAVWSILTEDGRFVFNTFRKPRWGWKLYRRGGVIYLEASGHLGRTVMHVQASPTIGLDVSRFHWYTHEEIMRAMSLFFDVEHQFRGPSAHYLCHRKDRPGLRELIERWRNV